MGEILFLAHRIPFPPDRGDKIRSHHVLKALARIAPVHVGCLAENAEDRAQESELAQLAASHCVAERKGNLALDGIRALATGRSVSEASFASRQLQLWVDRVLAIRPIEAIYVFSGQMTQYLSESFGGRLVVDFVDADSAKFAAYGQEGGIMAPIHRREAAKLRALEASFAAMADHSLLVTEEEAALFRSRLPQGSAVDVRVMRNGIDAEEFDPKLVEGVRLPPVTATKLIFTGQLDYPPNEAAVKRLATRILPIARCDWSMHVVGRNPTASVNALRDERFWIWPNVPKMNAYLGGADIAVVPLDIARGVQNKVLEAMAMGLPCILSHGAATGIPAQDGRDFIIARSDEVFAATIDDLAANPSRAKTIGHAARRWVIENASWDAALRDLPKLIGIEAGR